MLLSQHGAAAKLALIVVRAAVRPGPDIQSVEALSEAVGLTRRVLQNRCQAAGLKARHCVHFVQCLRSVLAVHEQWEPAALLPIVDPRTLRKMLTQAGLTDTRRPDVATFVNSQQFCGSPSFKSAVINALNSWHA